MRLFKKKNCKHENWTIIPRVVYGGVYIAKHAQLHCLDCGDKQRLFPVSHKELIDREVKKWQEGNNG